MACCCGTTFVCPVSSVFVRLSANAKGLYQFGVTPAPCPDQEFTISSDGEQTGTLIAPSSVNYGAYKCQSSQTVLCSRQQTLNFGSKAADIVLTFFTSGPDLYFSLLVSVYISQFRACGGARNLGARGTYFKCSAPISSYYSNGSINMAEIPSVTITGESQDAIVVDTSSSFGFQNFPAASGSVTISFNPLP